MRSTLLLLLLICSLKLAATHIIGGVISYKYGGNNVYNFTMKIYRDCSSTTPYEFNVRIPAYLGSNTTPFTTTDVTITKANVLKIIPPTFDCVIVPGNICVEEATYKWNMTLPKSNQSYHISYQVCCRNQTISNIINPINYGGTFTVEITPDAQQLNNNGPEFLIFPPTAICVGEPLIFDNSASDVDSDQLIYEFCSPLEGITRGSTRCKSGGVIVACPPPYPSLPYVAPTYTATKPLVSNPLLKINATTGQITGTPTEIGEYVVGVCVKEYRNGILLSTMIRDFQFNVIQCKKTVVGIVSSDSVTANGDFLIKSCNDKTVKLINKSFERANITNFYWKFDFDTSRKYLEWEPTITLPDTGFFKGQLLLNPGTKCSDTATVVIYFPGSNYADFSIKYDTCKATPVQFSQISDTSTIKINYYKWTLDNKDTLTQAFQYLYDTPGTKKVVLEVQNKLGCTSRIEKEFDWLPAPKLIFIKPEKYILCSPGTFVIENLSRPINPNYKVEWNFFDGKIETGQIATHEYKAPGTYSLGIKVTSPIGCVTENLFSNWIKVNPNPIADFEYSPTKLTQLQSKVDFKDKSTDASYYNWFFDKKDLDRSKNPTYTFKDTGWHNITLFVRHQSGCLDSITKQIYVDPVAIYYLPNAFTPNNDTNNDEYKGKGYISDKNVFKMLIYSRWGELIFQSNDPNRGWNGRLNNEGEILPQGTYFAYVSFTDYNGKSNFLTSNVMLLK
jgi:gliding motility-associated-like protein